MNEFVQQWHNEFGCSALQLQSGSRAQPRRRDTLAALEESEQFECEASRDGSWTRLSFSGLVYDAWGPKISLHPHRKLKLILVKEGSKMGLDTSVGDLLRSCAVKKLASG